MAKINPERLKQTLKHLAPIYLVSGDEPLQVLESCDAIRLAARNNGFSERERYHTDDSHFQWQQLIYSSQSLGLFGDKKIIEIQLHTNKVPEPAAKTLMEYCENPSEDVVLLLSAPKLDRKANNSKWYKRIDQIGIIVTIWPVSEKQLPRWIAQRLASKGLKAPAHAIDILAAKVEGNLLAASQEIEKLSLLTSDSNISAELMSTAVANSARYSVFGLIDKALFGDTRGTATCIAGLKEEGTEPPIVLWALTREIRNLVRLKQAQAKGQNISTIARQLGIFDKRLPIVKQALGRLKPNTLRALLRTSALCDKTIKGRARLSSWDLLLEISLTLCGSASLSPSSLKKALDS